MPEPLRTPFAGLLRIAPGEPLSIQGFEFQYVDPLIIDHLLKVGAITHKHDGLGALANPAAAPSITTLPTGGGISAATTVTVAHAWIDKQGGETLASPTANVKTAASFPDPQDAPITAVSYAAGALLAANYVYGVTVTDGEGGESAISPIAEAVVEPGFATAEVTITNLKVILEEVAGVTVGAEWRLWRRQNGGEWNLIDTGTGTTVVDNGTLVPDCTVQPPTTSTVHATNSVTVEVPKPPAGVEFFRLYLTTNGGFGPNSFVAEYPASEAEKPIVLTSVAVLAGTPPVVSRAIAHANKIDPDTDLLDWHFKRPVKKASELPTEGNEEGDVRLDLETRFFYIWNSETKEWKEQSVSVEEKHWRAPVVKVAELPATENVEGDVRYVDEAKQFYVWNGGTKEWNRTPDNHTQMIHPFTWAIAGVVSAGVIPGPFILVGEHEVQHVLGIEGDVGVGEVEVTLLHNGAPVGELTALKVSGPFAVTLAEPLLLANKDSLKLEVVSSTGGEELAYSAFVSHIAEAV